MLAQPEYFIDLPVVADEHGHPEALIHVISDTFLQVICERSSSLSVPSFGKFSFSADEIRHVKAFDAFPLQDGAPHCIKTCPFLIRRDKTCNRQEWIIDGAAGVEIS